MFTECLEGDCKMSTGINATKFREELFIPRRANLIPNELSTNFVTKAKMAFQANFR